MKGGRAIGRRGNKKDTGSGIPLKIKAGDAFKMSMMNMRNHNNKIETVEKRRENKNIMTNFIQKTDICE